MLLYAGIDEAGYGPLLGPLCVACAIIEVTSVDPTVAGTKAPDIWSMLKRAVCSSPADKRRRIAIADSKLLKGPRDGKEHPLRHLERGVLAVLATQMGSHTELVGCDDSLFKMLGVSVNAPDDAPWYASVTVLPVAQERDGISIAANRLRIASTEAGVRFAALACESLDGVEFNRHAASIQKSDMNFTMAMRHVDRVWRAYGVHHPRIIVDRQGGRTHYREPLQFSFPDASIAILGETDSVSRYRLERDGTCITISFETESESRHFPNALASMTAKFVRELFMQRMNRFFCGHLPELKPTAGYVEDGRRYLADIGPVLKTLKIRSDQLVRCR
ncbi:MAG: hypothetical protein SGJ11_11075 [Phycisphaerae bacterium]|nr:hypothetical protein [Phycisphaerae bacterium]